MMTKLFNEGYFDWLIAQIDTGRTHRTFEDLFRCMHRREFVWFIPNDDNRVGDAWDLRREFWGEGHPLPQNGVSILEVLVALSRRAAWVSSGESHEWMWIFIKNLKLNKFPDPISFRKENQVEDILETFVWRTYAPNGEGGLFPLHETKEDQTKVELWYQMHAYINEKIPI
ncbi:MAG TPA: hypothetical protein VH187_20000 [Scandinavium sp.]|uniref:hypothetical protein n=1 Tax=Scandinavium sp. TaxID=2830653 RepID=UPI002E339E90|nr:hypothetical protein [Scandinavium sp.]HEX4503413.1 hypothetical protein [Scandinavium sp.]